MKWGEMNNTVAWENFWVQYKAEKLNLSGLIPYIDKRHNIIDVQNSQVFLAPFIDIREPLRDLWYFFLIQFKQIKAFRNAASHHVPNSKCLDLFRSLQNKQSFNISTECFWDPWVECSWMTILCEMCISQKIIIIILKNNINEKLDFLK